MVLDQNGSERPFCAFYGFPCGDPLVGVDVDLLVPHPPLEEKLRHLAEFEFFRPMVFHPFECFVGSVADQLLDRWPRQFKHRVVRSHAFRHRGDRLACVRVEIPANTFFATHTMKTVQAHTLDRNAEFFGALLRIGKQLYLACRPCA